MHIEQKKDPDPHAMLISAWGKKKIWMGDTTAAYSNQGKRVVYDS